MKTKKILSDKATETNIHVSFQIPTVFELNVDIARKTWTNRHTFFNDKENFEMKNIGNVDTEKIPIAITKL